MDNNFGTNTKGARAEGLQSGVLQRENMEQKTIGQSTDSNTFERRQNWMEFCELPITPQIETDTIFRSETLGKAPLGSEAATGLREWK